MFVRSQNAAIPRPFPPRLSSDIIQENLVAWYRFDQYTGQRLWDYSDYHNHGTLGSTAGVDDNDPTWTTKGLYFDGGDYVRVGDIGKTVRTLHIVFDTRSEINAASPGQVLVNLTSALHGVLALGQYTTALANEIITVATPSGARAGWCDAAASIGVGWHDIIVRWLGTTCDIWLDGVQKSVTLSASLVPQTADSLQFARRVDGGMTFTGAIAHLLLHSTLLGTQEALSNRSAVRSLLLPRGVLLSL